MTQDQPSTTALISAFGRAYHATHAEAKIFDDFLAAQLFTPEQHALFTDNLSHAFAFFEPEAADRVTAPAEMLAGFMRSQSLSITLSQARYLEEVLEAEIPQGVQQYVILGAGLDTFVWRRPALVAQLDVFEVDRPGTQNYKRQRLADLGWTMPVQLHWVPVDFLKDHLGNALHGAGYDPNKRTLFSWLGVTYYLPGDVIDSTLCTLAQLAPSGSTVIFDYLDTDAFVPERTAPRVARMQQATIQSGEPMITGLDPAALAAELEALGFHLQENLSPANLQERYFRDRTDGYYAFEHIHFARAIVS